MRLPPEEDALALRELHDVITHAVTELAFEAGAEATRRHGDARAAEAARALTSVMRDLRRMAPLIQCGGDAPYGPQPDLYALEELVRAESPVPLEARLDVCDAEVPASTALACYRIVGHLLAAAAAAGSSAAGVEVVASGTMLALWFRSAGAPPDRLERRLRPARRRAAIHGGRLHFRRLAAGWACDVTLPLDG